jgi:hypothetical protein
MSRSSSVSAAFCSLRELLASLRALLRARPTSAATARRLACVESF